MIQRHTRNDDDIITGELFCLQKPRFGRRTVKNQDLELIIRVHLWW